MKTLFLTMFAFVTISVFSQEITGTQLLEKAISYHDPNGAWDSFNGEFTLALSMPDKSERKSVITLNLPEEYFNVAVEQNGKTSFREISNNQCRFTDEKGEVQTATTEEEDCERTVMFKNYYTYLYGLPMKLKDPGTRINPVVKRKTFKGKEYLVLRVAYDEEVGSDIWQFYFNPETNAMEIYQFFKGEDEKTGEYILLTDEVDVNGIRMPKDRAWYYNKDDGYLGTDSLVRK